MVPILVASNTGYAGRTFISLGLALKLKDMGYKVGVMKPFGTVPVKSGKDVYDSDALFFKETLELEEPLDVISPFVMSYEEQTLLYQGKAVDAKKRVLAAYKSFKKKDFIIICGANDLFEGALLGIDALSLAEDMKAQVLMVEPWRGDSSADSLFGAQSGAGQTIRRRRGQQGAGGHGRAREEYREALSRQEGRVRLRRDPQGQVPRVRDRWSS